MTADEFARRARWPYLWVAVAAVFVGYLVATVTLASPINRPAAWHVAAASLGRALSMAALSALVTYSILYANQLRWSRTQWANAVVITTVFATMVQLGEAGRALASKGTASSDISVAQQIARQWRCARSGSPPATWLFLSNGTRYVLFDDKAGAPVYPDRWLVNEKKLVLTLGGAPDNSFRGLISAWTIDHVDTQSLVLGLRDDPDKISCSK